MRRRRAEREPRHPATLPLRRPARHRSRRRIAGKRRAPHPGQRLPPAGLFSRQLKHSFGARRAIEQGPPVGDRILLGRSRQFINETFGDENIVRGPTLRQKAVGNARRLHSHIFDVHVRQRIDQIDRAVGAVGIEAVLEPWRKPSRDDRRSRVTMAPGDRHSLVVETGGEFGRTSKAGTYRAGCLPRGSRRLLPGRRLVARSGRRG